MPSGLDTIGWFIATLHDTLGHAKAAAVLGEPPGDTSACILCRHDRGEATRAEVIAAIGAPRAQ